MESSLKITLLLIFTFAIQPSFCQNGTTFCKAVEKMNFKKVERQVKKVIHKNKVRRTYFNGETSRNQIILSSCLDSMTNWFKKQDCVEDAFWDKCQTKAAIYPGWSSIGVKFRTKKGIIEKCFLIQEGTTGQINFIGWKPKIFKPKKILVYKKMYDCEKFIEQQKMSCERMN